MIKAKRQTEKIAKQTKTANGQIEIRKDILDWQIQMLDLTGLINERTKEFDKETLNEQERNKNRQSYKQNKMCELK